MTDKQKKAYVDLLNIVEDNAKSFARLAGEISSIVSNVRERIAKIRDDLGPPTEPPSSST